MHGPLDVITPDELTVGRGSTEMGGYLDEPQGMHDFDFDGDSETTYVALTWDIPSFVDPTLSREEWRSIREGNLLAEESVAKEEAALKLNLREGATPPPLWAVGAVVGCLAAFFLLIFIKSRNSQPWN